MKYLNTYRLFESLWDKDITDSIKDILIDLEDDECKIDIKYYPGYGNTTSIRGEREFQYSYCILITKPSNDFDIDSKIEQLSSYMKSEGYPHLAMEELSSKAHTFLFFAKDRYGKGI
jgi:hypothetical protein